MKKSMKKLVGLMLMAGTILGTVKTVSWTAQAQKEAGWQENAVGWWYQNPDGSYQKNGWFQDSDQNWYYFNSDGYMQTGWIWDQGFWYFADQSGRMQTGVIQVNGQVYYLNPVSGSDFGKMQTGKVMIQGTVYHFNASGVLVGDRPTVEHSYQIPAQDLYSQIENSSSNRSSKVNNSNKDQIVLLESTTLEGLVRELLGDRSNRSLTWNDLKEYTNVSFQIMTDSRGKLIFQMELGTAEEISGKIQVDLEELEQVVTDLSHFPNLSEVGVAGTYVKYVLKSASGIDQIYDENLMDLGILLGILEDKLAIDDIVMRIDLELSLK